MAADTGVGARDAGGRVRVSGRGHGPAQREPGPGPGHAGEWTGKHGYVDRGNTGNALENAGERAVNSVNGGGIVSASPAIWVADDGLSGHTGIRRRYLPEVCSA